MTIKRCTSAFMAVVDGVPRVVPVGELLDDTDPVYAGREALFENVETYVSRRSAGPEDATADPGRPRTLTAPTPSRAPAKKAPAKKTAAKAPAKKAPAGPEKTDPPAVDPAAETQKEGDQ